MSGRRRVLFRERDIDPSRILRVNGNGRDAAGSRINRIVRREKDVRVVANLVFDRILAWVRKDHAPRLSSIFATPQRHVSGIDHILVLGIESEAVETCKQVEHAPGIAIVMGNVAASHIAMFEHQAGIVRAYGGCDHGAPSARADDLPSVKARSLS